MRFFLMTMKKIIKLFQCLSHKTAHAWDILVPVLPATSSKTSSDTICKIQRRVNGQGRSSAGFKVMCAPAQPHKLFPGSNLQWVARRWPVYVFLWLQGITTPLSECQKFKKKKKGSDCLRIIFSCYLQWGIEARTILHKERRVREPWKWM